MLHLERSENGITIENIIFWGDEKKEGKISLSKTLGEKMHYGIEHKKFIDFPGEYEIDNIFFIVYEYNGGLQYVIKMDDKRIAIIQDPKTLEINEYEDISHRMYSNNNVEEAITRMEFDGEKININSIS